MIGLAQVEILTAGAGQARGQFRPDECAQQSQDAAENPDAENQEWRVDMQGDHVGIDEDARAYDSAHDDHGGVEKVETAR